MAAMLLAEAVDGEDTVCAHDGAHEGRGRRGELNERDQILTPPKTGLRVHWRHLAVQQVLGELRHARPLPCMHVPTTAPPLFPHR